MKKLFFLLMGFFCVSEAFSQGFFHRGDLEASGAIQFSMDELYDSYTAYHLLLSPNISIYLNDGLYLGPTIQYKLGWAKYYSLNEILLGGNIGFVIPTQFNIKPYFGGTYGLLFQTTKDNNGGPNGPSSESGTNLNYSIYAGIKCIISQNVFMNVQPTYSHTKYPIDMGDSKINFFGVQLALSARVFSGSN